MIISVVNTKGGVGKSTVAINLAEAFARDGFDTLLVDTDPHGTAMEWGARRENPSPRLNVISVTNSRSLMNDYESLGSRYDMLIVDGTPHLEQMLTVTVAVAGLAIIPINPSPNDIWKLGPLVDEAQRIQQKREDLLLRFLINNHVPRTRLSREVEAALEPYGIPPMHARLGTRMDYRDSLASGVGALAYNNPKATEEILAMLGEVKQLIGLTEKRKAG